MYNRFQLLGKYLDYRWRAHNGKGHGMHSPFVFDFITSVLNDKKKYEAYDKVERLRKELYSSTETVQVEDFGAGSRQGSSSRRSISTIAKHAAKPAKFGQLLYRMVSYYRPSTILELGTSLGLTTSYLAMGKEDAQVITMEGSTAIAQKAKQHFGRLGIRNISMVEGNFDYTLTPCLATSPEIDFAFIDGNHRLEPTLDYFRQLLQKTNNDSILIFDDIHWSAGMEAAWEQICRHPRVTCSIDLFFIGIVFFRKEFREKQHFLIRF